MGALIVKIIALIIVAIGVISICDARDLSKRFFSDSDKNSSAMILRVSGFIIAIMGGIAIYIS